MLSPELDATAVRLTYEFGMIAIHGLNSNAYSN